VGNPYAFGTYSAETKVLQERLSGHAPSFDTKGTDGIFGKDTRDAVQAAQEYYAISPADGVVRTDLLVELGITSPAAAVANNPLSQFLSLISLSGRSQT
jgi:peptidoglycan hydrolase-like protein with peptidoglycan-binding domain